MIETLMSKKAWDYSYSDDQTTLTTDTPGFKPFTTFGGVFYKTKTVDKSVDSPKSCRSPLFLRSRIFVFGSSVFVLYPPQINYSISLFSC